MSAAPVAAVTSPAPAGPSQPAAATSPGLALRVSGRRIPIVLPSRHDPRLKLSAVIVGLQVLGQAVLGFKVSIAQILVTIAVCALVDTAVTYRRQRILAWPASALLTGNSIAFILRATGTKHGDWWTLHGIEYFIMAALISLLVKYTVRPGGHHRFNPSNVGLVWILLVIGPLHVFPQYLWWGPLGVPVLLALSVIVLGAGWVLRAVRMLPMALSFLVTFTALIAVFAATGHSFLAIWQSDPIRGGAYWLKICTSPELFVFVFFMMSDPVTAPKQAVARTVYGATTALVAAALISFQTTEFGIKVAILSSLTLVCALVPLIEAGARRLRRATEQPAGAAQRPGRVPPLRRWRLGTLAPATLAVVIIATTAVAGTAALAGDKDLTYIERGLTGKRNAQ